jgi:hypothetical protein
VSQSHDGREDLGPDAVPDIDCAEFVRMVDELVRTDPAAWGPVVDKHLTDCPPCVIYLQQMLDLRTILRHVQMGERLADDEVERVLHAITTH